jgi:dCMP deaminase
MNRVSKHNYYLDIAQTVAERSTCLRRKFGSIIVKDDTIISTGYNGAPRGRTNCTDLEYCYRDNLNIPRGTHYELCRAVHSEQNAIIAATKEQMLGATLYMVCVSPEDGTIVPNTTCCMMCKRVVINAGISTVIIRDDKENYRIINVSSWVEDDDSLSGSLGEY